MSITWLWLKVQNVLNLRKIQGQAKSHSFSYHKNDAVELTINEIPEIYRVQKISLTNKRVIFFEIDWKEREANDALLIALSDSNIRKHKLKKVSVNVLGRILW